MVGVSDDHGDAVYVYPRQVTCDLGFNHHVLFGSLSPSATGLFQPETALAPAIPFVPTARLLAEASPDFKFVALSAKPTRIFICYWLLPSIL